MFAFALGFIAGAVVAVVSPPVFAWVSGKIALARAQIK